MSKELIDIEGPLRIEDAKIKVTLYLDGDILKAVKLKAKEENKKYQSLVNETLREVFLDEKPIRKELQDLAKRVELLEANKS